VQPRKAALKRTTKETDISLSLSLDETDPVAVDTGVPFFDHMLTAMSFHGGFSLKVTASGDLSVDAHHLVEDLGIVLGDALLQAAGPEPSVKRFSHAVVPMDEALAETVIDVCGRSTCVYRADFPQKLIGTFDPALIREFFQALSQRAKISLHATVREGENSHHMAEALFKSLGLALAAAYTHVPGPRRTVSTKGTLA
jgi:imidazoleglycerol phosphate dehydratase HisB